MTYSEIINQNIKNASIKWWPKFAYHYTDIQNAVNIISTGFLLSRIKATEANLMTNDNASIQVINMTESTATSHVRFYFRPLTPTQYYNEGFKHHQIRYCEDQNANVPVPIFFAFDLEKLLNNPRTKFSELSQAGYSAPVYSGVDAFSKLNFSKIYSDGATDSDTIKYRHAEILYPDSYSIDDSLQFILCRNELEKTTLMSLLKETNIKKYYKYKNIIKVCKTKMFESNGLFLKDVSFGDDSISFIFADTYNKRQYENHQMQKFNIKELLPVSITFRFQWTTLSGAWVNEKSIEKTINYQNPSSIIFCRLPRYKNAKVLKISLYIEKKLVCYVVRSIENLEFM